MIKDKNMAKNIERESLVSALAHCSLRDLPKIDNGEDIWLYAIAKVEKSDGSTSYALVEKTENLDIRYLKDFGSIYPIRKVVSYHPFSFLKPTYLPKFKTEKKEDVIDEYLAPWIEELKAEAAAAASAESAGDPGG